MPSPIGIADGEHAGNDHLLERALGRDVDALGVVGPSVRVAGQQARDLLELAAHLADHRERRAADSVHRERPEQERQHRADEQTRPRQRDSPARGPA